MIIDAHCHLWDKDQLSPQAPTQWREHAATLSTERLLKLMNESQIDKTVLLGVDFSLFPLFIDYRETNNYLASVIDKHPDRFLGFLAVDPRKGQEAIEEVDRCVELGFKGVKIWPYKYYVDDSSFYAFYETVREHNLPILFHTGASDPPSYMKHYRPFVFDTVATDFPEITIILAHMGKPWVDEAIRAARKNRNVYLDFSAWDDLYLSRPMYLVETIAKAKCFCGLDKILFGSDWPVQIGGPTSYHGVTEHMSFKDWIDVVKNLKTPEILKQLDYPEITEKDKQMILGENAAKILNL